MTFGHSSGEEQRPTLHGALARWAAARPHEIFVAEVESGRTLTYADAYTHVRALQAWLGERPRTILAALPAGIDLSLLWLAAITGGHRLVPSAPETTPSEFAELTRRWHPDLAALGEPGPRSRELASGVAVVDRTFLATLTSATSHASPAMSTDWHAREGELALTTSGTTGEPKGLCLRASQIAWTADGIRHSHKLTSADRGLSVLPFYHINAPVVSLCTTLLAGATIVIAPRFSLSRFWSWIEREQITWASIVPTLVALLLQGETPEHISDSLRFVRTASAPLPVAHLRAFERRFGVPLIETYGLSEAASTIVANPVLPGVHKAGSVGLPLEGVELRVCRLNEGPLQDVPHGEEGEVCVRGPSVIAGYLGRANDPSFVRGWFRTGDLGYRDSDGYLYLTGRLRDVINYAGHKVAPREVEEVLLASPAVREVAVIGRPDPLYGERVVAYVVPDVGSHPPKQLSESLLSECAQQLTAYKVPQEIKLVACLPRTPTGKVRRHMLSSNTEADLDGEQYEHVSA